MEVIVSFERRLCGSFPATGATTSMPRRPTSSHAYPHMDCRNSANRVTPTNPGNGAERRVHLAVESMFTIWFMRRHSRGATPRAR
jgi:hypothetical protein